MREAMTSALWHGRVDAAEREAGRRWHQIVKPYSPDTPGGAVALLGFACDAGVARNGGRIGAAVGPAAIRDILRNMPAHGLRALIDAGDVACVDDELESAQSQLAAHVASLLDEAHFPIVLGGGHEMAYGTFCGLEQHLATTHGDNQLSPRIGIVNLDAHFDLRLGERGNSGTPFRQIAERCARRQWSFNYCCLGVSRFSNTASLFERARELGATWRLDEEMSVALLDQSMTILNRFLASVDVVYLTICLDVLPAAIAPGVSAPAARGVALEVIEPLIEVITRSRKLRVADIAEMNPQFDIDQRTARVAARLVARIAEAMSTQ